VDIKTILDELAREHNFKDASAHCATPYDYGSGSQLIIYCRVLDHTLDLEYVNIDTTSKKKMWATFVIDGTTITDMVSKVKVDVHDPDSISKLKESFVGEANQDNKSWGKDLVEWQRISKQLNF
jgi:hypothetical protein